MSSMGKTTSTEWAAIGRIVAPFGIRGELKVFPLTDVPNRFTHLKNGYLSPHYTLYAIETVRPYKGDMVLLKLQGINDATTAESLRNCELCLPLDELTKLPSDSYYQHDILGLHVRTLAGRELGTICDIIVTGSNDVYVIEDANRKQVLIPAIKEVVKQVDLVEGMMYIEPMQGLLDDDASIDEVHISSAEEHGGGLL